MQDESMKNGHNISFISLILFCILTLNRRVGGSIKADTKIGFTLMVTAELNVSKIKEPFLVFKGTKMEDAKTIALCL